MSDLSLKDVTGTPRSERAVQEALDYVTKQLVIDPAGMSKDGVPRAIHYIVIKDALRELLAMRAVIAAARERRRVQHTPSADATFVPEPLTHPGKANAIPPPPSDAIFPKEAITKPTPKPGRYIHAAGSLSTDVVPTGMPDEDEPKKGTE